MIVKPKIRGFICTTAHPKGCAAHVAEQIAYIQAQGPITNGPKKVLVIGASTGYGLASRITAAFACGAAVITSQTSSCGEIAADAAMLINPSDTKAMANAMERVLIDTPFKESLCQEGLKRAKDFSFLKTAQNTLDVYAQTGS